MAKWADYGISHVRYGAHGGGISHLRIREDKGDTLGPPAQATREDAVHAIEKNGTTFCTISKGSDGKWTRGEDVHIVLMNGAKYLRTDRNRTAADNLGELPEF